MSTQETRPDVEGRAAAWAAMMKKSPPTDSREVLLELEGAEVHVRALLAHIEAQGRALTEIVESWRRMAGTLREDPYGLNSATLLYECADRVERLAMGTGDRAVGCTCQFLFRAADREVIHETDCPLRANAGGAS